MVKVVAGWALAACALVGACGTSGGDEAGTGGAGNSGSGGAGALGGEGGSGSGDDGLAPELRAELEAFCAWWAELTCDIARENTPHRVDEEHCAPTETATCIHRFLPGIVPAVAEGRLVYHPESRAAVAADLRRFSGVSFSEREAMPSWQSLFQGTVANGEPCASHEGEAFYANECADGRCPWNECPGTCKPYPGPDDECDWQDERCHPSAYCDYGCVARPGEGEPCELEGQPCLPPLRCRMAAGDAQGTCGVPAELGQPCAVTSDCAEGACHDAECSYSALAEPCENSSECEPELTCIGKVCAPRQSGSTSAGPSCGADRDCVPDEMCLSGDLWSGCGEPVGLRSQCSPYQGCPRGLLCQGGGFGVCVVPTALGDACSGETCIPGGYCFAGRCLAQTANVCDPTP